MKSVAYGLKNKYKSGGSPPLGLPRLLMPAAGTMSSGEHVRSRKVMPVTRWRTAVRERSAAAVFEGFQYRGILFQRRIDR